MLDDVEVEARNASPPKHHGLRNKAYRRTRPNRANPFGMRRGCVLSMTGWRSLLSFPILAGITIYVALAATTTSRMLLPIEVMGEDGTIASTTAVLQPEEAEAAHSIWLQVNGLRYPTQGSMQVNSSAWIPLNNDSASISEPGRSFGGVGGGFATLGMTVLLPKHTVVVGTNTIRFRFNQTDGVASGYRVLAWNFLTTEGGKILPPDDFIEDAPETWKPPLLDVASIQKGRELWQTASLTASSLPGSPTIQARCADCHAKDGRDLKYFNFSNGSIVARSRFHGLSTLQGEQIASYIRSLPLPNPGRPWNPPYQPGPGLDEQPVSNWGAGAGLSWVFDQDADALPYLLSPALASKAAAHQAIAHSTRELVGEITPKIFRPDANLNPRQVPIAFQLPDWSQWLPRIHPKDAWGPAFAQSEFGKLYEEEPYPTKKHERVRKSALRTVLLATKNGGHDPRPVTAAFNRWSHARRTFLKRFVKPRTTWSPSLTEKVYSTQLWQLVKTWEMTQEFGLEGRGRDAFASGADSRRWFNTIPAETAPAATRIPDGAAGVGGSALTNEYFTASWYELQILLNSGNHQHRDRRPVDWVYVIGRFRDLYGQTHQPEPVRLLVAVIKALQSTDARLDPEDLRDGWRPNENVDPRIMISPNWAPNFKPLPLEVHRALTASLLSAWMDKNLQYPVAQHLPLRLPPQTYAPPRSYADISGGQVWEAAQKFYDAGVPADLVERLLQWGMVYTDRAARLQYEGRSSSRHR